MGINNWDVVFCLMEGVVISYFFCGMLRLRYKKEFAYVTLIIGMLVLYAVGTRLDNYVVVEKGFDSFPLAKQALIKTCITQGGMLLMLYLLFEKKGIIGSYIVFNVIGVLFNLLVAAIITVTLHVSLTTDLDWKLLFYLRCLTCFMLAGIFSITIGVKDKYSKREIIGLALLQICLLISNYSTMIFFYKGENTYINEHPLFVLIFYTFPALFVNMSAAEIMHRFTRMSNYQNQLKYEQRLGEKGYQYYQLALSNEKKIRAFRHEVANRLQIIQGLIDQGEMESANRFTQDFSKQYANVASLRYCDNAVINMIISVKHDEAAKRGVELKVNVQPELGGISVKDVDLSSLLTEIIDRAVEQECSMAAPSGRCVEGYIKSEGGLLTICVRHHIDKTAELNTSVKNTDKEIQLSKRIVKRYGGKIQIEQIGASLQIKANLLLQT